ncbi:MAG: hypothetical protein AB1512_23270 [Thermodesulfobacteriota bacterium]
MKTVVHDASVLIDLVSAGFLGPWFKAGLAAVTTSLVWREVNRKSQKAKFARFVGSGDLRIVSISSEDMTRIVRLQADLPSRVTLEDASVLYLSSTWGTILLTSDKVLRRCAADRGIEVHGLLWVFDLLVSRGKIPPGAAADRLEQMAAPGTGRLPEKECRQRIRKWRTE